MSSSSLSPVTMKSENEVKVELPEDSDPDSFATPSPPKKSRVLTREPCLICSKNDNQHSSEDDPLGQEFELFQFPGASGSDLLNQQMWTTFVLRKLLKLPLSKFSDILKTAGSSIHPHQWFSLCRECSEMVNSIAESEVTIKLLQQKIKTITGTIQRKLEESLEIEARKDKDNFFVIRSEIRKSLNIKAPKKTTTATVTTTPHAHVLTPSNLMSSPAPFTIVEPLLEPKSEIHDPDDNDNEDLSPPSPSPVGDTQGSDSDEEWILNPSPPITPISNFMSRSWSNWKRSRISKDPLEDNDDDDDDQNEKEEQEESESEDQNESDSDLEPDSLRKRPKKRWVSFRKRKMVQKKTSGSNATEAAKYQCHICPRSFRGEANLQRHLKYHRRTQKLFGGKRDCVICKVPYDKFLTLNGHYLKVHHTSLHRSWDGEAPHQDYLYTDKESKKRLLVNLKSKGVDIKARPALKLDDNIDLEHKCHLCPKQYSRLNDFQIHLSYHKHCETKYQGRFDCFKCKVPYISAKGVTQHLKLDHGLILDKDWDPNTPQIDHVKPKLKPASGSVAGGKDEDDSFKCEICGFVCKTGSGLKSHMMYKHVDRPSNKDKRKKGGDPNSPQVQHVKPGRLEGIKRKRAPGSIAGGMDEDRSFKCEICGFVCKRGSGLKSHMINKHGDRPSNKHKGKKGGDRNTPEVDQVKPLKPATESVEGGKDEDDSFNCEICGFVCKRGSGLKSHMMYKHKDHPSNKYKSYKRAQVCDKCGVDCGMKHKLDQHIFNHKIYDNSVDHSISSTDFVCNICQKTVPTRLMLCRHKIQQHHEELNITVEKCEECPKVFRRKLELSAHVQIIHRRLGRFNCDRCPYAAMSPDAMKKHMLKHEETRQRNYVCEFCSASYCYVSALNDHLQRYHLEQYDPSRNKRVFGGVAVEKLQSEQKFGVLKKIRGQGQNMKPVNCKYCKHVLPHALAFKMHLKSVHQDLFVHKCDVDDCGRTYMSLQSLQLHKKISHVNKKEVRCGWCFKKVLSKVYLYSHNRWCPKKPNTAKNMPKIFVARNESNNVSQA